MSPGNNWDNDRYRSRSRGDWMDNDQKRSTSRGNRDRGATNYRKRGYSPNNSDDEEFNEEDYKTAPPWAVKIMKKLK